MNKDLIFSFTRIAVLAPIEGPLASIHVINFNLYALPHSIEHGRRAVQLFLIFLGRVT